MAVLTDSDAVVVGALLKGVTDLMFMRTGKKVSVDDLKELLDDQRVQRQLLDDERRAAVAKFMDDDAAGAPAGDS